MTDHFRHDFWITNHLANPILRTVLRSPVGRRLGQHLAILRYRGRRTGQHHSLVVQYARDGQRVWVVPGEANRKTWWRNLREPSAVEIRLAGKDFHGNAVALEGHEHPDDVRRGLALYLYQLPRTSKALGLPPTRSTAPDTDLADLALRTVMVRLDLAADTPTRVTR